MTAVPEVWLLPTGQVAIRVGEDSWRVVGQRDRHVSELPADAVRLVPAGGSAPADEPEYLADVERNAVALAAEIGRMRPVVDAVEALVDEWPTNLPYGPYQRRVVDAVAAYRAGGSAPHQGASPRVWFDHEDIPPSVRVIDEMGDIHWPGEDCYPGELCRMVGFGPVVEVLLPDHATAVAAERERRALLGAGETTKADR